MSPGGATEGREGRAAVGTEDGRGGASPLRVPLSRERIVVAAVRFIDQRGLADLTMRRLGTELGVEAMSMYRYVPGREELLDGVVETVVAELHQDTDVLAAPRDGWQDFLQRLAHGVRRIALRHPRAFPLVASRPPEAPWLRPPLRSLAWVESFLRGMLAEGFSQDAAVAAYRAFTSFLLGHLLLEAAVHGADVGPLDVGASVHPGPLPAEYPLVQGLSAALAEDHSAVEFEEALEDLIDRVRLLRGR